MKKYFLFFVVLSLFASCSKDDEDIFGEFFDIRMGWEFTGEEWKFHEDGVDYSILGTSEGKEYFYLIAFEGEELSMGYHQRLYDYDKLAEIIPPGYENPTPVIVDRALKWVAFYQNDYRNVAVIDNSGKVKTYSNRTFKKGKFHSEVSRLKAYYIRDNYEYTFRIFDND